MASAAAGSCPDRNLLAGFAEGRLMEEEREALEAHLADCAGCRDLVGRLDHAGRPGLRVPVRAVAAAAAVLLALGGAFLLRGRGGPPMEERLSTAAAGIARRHPGLGEDLRPLGREERLRRAEGLRGGALRAILPVRKVLDPRPEFRWAGGPAGGEVRVSLSGPGGVPLWSLAAEGERLGFPADRPPLEPGRTYTWAVRATMPLGPEASDRAFTVATEAEGRAFEEAVRWIDAEAPADLADLLKAGLALRREFCAEAVGFARRAADARPSEPLVREVLFQALERTGSPEAARWFPVEGGGEGR